MKVVIDDKIPFIKGVLEPFSDVVYASGGLIDPEMVRDADALLIRTRTKCDKSLLDGSKVAFIGSATIGYDHIDLRYCGNNGTHWTNAPGCNSSSVMQYIVAALFVISDHGRFSLKDKTLGIIGAGNVGSKVEIAAKAIGMRVLINDPPRSKAEIGFESVSLEVLLRESDIVTLHVPLQRAGEDQTYHLINSRSLKLMKRGAWLINSARGEVVDTLALKQAVSSDLLSGVVFDVWEDEPDIDIELMEKTLISTPHIAGYSLDGKANGTAQVVNALSLHFGLPLNDWYPEDIPLPMSGKIEIPTSNCQEDSVLKEVVKSAYDIVADNERLKKSPSSFEYLRGNYVIRRDFDAYEVIVGEDNLHTSSVLEGLGFQVVSPT